MFLNRYTANLAAHLTATVAGIEYDSMADLRHNNVPIYVRDDHHTRNRFKTLYKDIYENIRSNNWFWKNDTEIVKHLKEGYAVFAQSYVLERVKRRNCDINIRTITELGSQYQGFAMRKGHPLLANISMQIIKYLSSGRMLEILERYHKDACPLKTAASSLSRADLAKMKGLLLSTIVLIVIGAGVVFAQSMVEWWGKSPSKMSRKIGTKGSRLH